MGLKVTKQFIDNICDLQISHVIGNQDIYISEQRLVIDSVWRAITLDKKISKDLSKNFKN